MDKDEQITIDAAKNAKDKDDIFKLVQEWYKLKHRQSEWWDKRNYDSPKEDYDEWLEAYGLAFDAAITAEQLVLDKMKEIVNG